MEEIILYHLENDTPESLTRSLEVQTTNKRAHHRNSFVSSRENSQASRLLTIYMINGCEKLAFPFSLPVLLYEFESFSFF
jgi:hypothetical protein